MKAAAAAAASAACGALAHVHTARRMRLCSLAKRLHTKPNPVAWSLECPLACTHARTRHTNTQRSSQTRLRHSDVIQAAGLARGSLVVADTHTHTHGPLCILCAYACARARVSAANLTDRAYRRDARSFSTLTVFARQAICLNKQRCAHAGQPLTRPPTQPQTRVNTRYNL